MTAETSTTLDLSVAETATGFAQTTAEGNTVTSSSSRGITFYFQCAVVVIGVVGTATNALILYALVASKQHKKQVPIVNQNALDLFGSFFSDHNLFTEAFQYLPQRIYWLLALHTAA